MEGPSSRASFGALGTCITMEIKFLEIDRTIWSIGRVIKGNFISKPFDHFSHLTHHWPKNLTKFEFCFSQANLTKEICPRKSEFKFYQIFRPVVGQVTEMIKWFRNKITFK